MTLNKGTIRQGLAKWLTREVAMNGAKPAVLASVGLATDVGRVRNQNEDKVAACRAVDRFGNSYVLVAVADGIGGLRDGAECAALAISVLFESVLVAAKMGRSNPATWLDQGMRDANAAVYELYRGRGGTTLSVVLISEVGKPCLASVGDSRIYEVKENSCAQLSTDDTIAGQLGQRRDGSHESSLLLQFIGMGPSLVLEVTSLDSKEERQLLLCSDGVYFVEPEGHRFLKLVIDGGLDVGPQVTARRLVEIAKWAGGPDNASAAVVATPIDFEKLAAMPTPFHIWDAYGDLAFLFTEAAVREVSQAQEVKLPEQLKSKPVAEKKPKAKSRKKSTKNKEKLDFESEDVALKEVPQVQLKFSSDKEG